MHPTYNSLNKSFFPPHILCRLHHTTIPKLKLTKHDPLAALRVRRHVYIRRGFIRQRQV